MSPRATAAAVIATNVRRLREERGWRQADLAELMAPTCGWTASTVAWVENGRRGIGAEEAPFLCHALRVDPVNLFDGVNVDGCSEPWNTETKAAVRDDLRKAAASLGVTPDRLAQLAEDHYGRPFHVERDARAGDVTGLTERQARAKRGHATRAILAELR